MKKKHSCTSVKRLLSPPLPPAVRVLYDFIYQDWDVQIKTKDNSPLTKADLSANKVICDALTESYPDIPM